MQARSLKIGHWRNGRHFGDGLDQLLEFTKAEHRLDAKTTRAAVSPLSNAPRLRNALPELTGAC